MALLPYFYKIASAWAMYSFRNISLSGLLNKRRTITFTDLVANVVTGNAAAAMTANSSR